MRKSNRLLSRLTGTLAALTLVVGLMPATALAADGSASITITEPVWSDTSKDWAGTEANAYLVLDQVNDTETDPAKKLYSVTNVFDAFSTSIRMTTTVRSMKYLELPELTAPCTCGLTALIFLPVRPSLLPVSTSPSPVITPRRLTRHTARLTW